MHDTPSTAPATFTEAGEAPFPVTFPASYLVEQSGIGAGNFKQIKAPDVPAGDDRYIMCSKDVSDETIGKLNKAITAKKGKK